MRGNPEELSPEDSQRMEELYGYFTEEQITAYLEERQKAFEENARSTFALMVEIYRRFGRVPDVKPKIWAIWQELGLDLTLVGR